jgi:hypothetical protein
MEQLEEEPFTFRKPKGNGDSLLAGRRKRKKRKAKQNKECLLNSISLEL